MKTFLTAAALVAALTLPAFAEGEQPSDKAGEAKGNVKASTDMKEDAQTRAGATGQGRVVVPGAVTSGQSTVSTNKDTGKTPTGGEDKGSGTGAGNSGNDSGGGSGGGAGGGSGGGGSR